MFYILENTHWYHFEGSFDIWDCQFFISIAILLKNYDFNHVGNGMGNELSYFFLCQFEFIVKFCQFFV